MSSDSYICLWNYCQSWDTRNFHHPESILVLFSSPFFVFYSPFFPSTLGPRQPPICCFHYKISWHSTNIIIQYALFCVWFPSLVTLVIFIHVVLSISSLYFLFLSSIPRNGYTTFCLSIHLLRDIWVVSSFVLYKAAMNIHIQVSVRTCVFIYLG